MDADYGKKVGRAFAAVYQLHRDVSRLLIDTSPRLGTGRTTSTAVIKETSWQVDSPGKWMPYSVCMSSAGGELPANVVETVMVYFWDEPPRPDEPHLILARVEFKQLLDGPAKPDYWDAWYSCFKWGQPFPAGVVNRFSPSGHERVEGVTVTAVPLFEITSVDDVLNHMQRVRERAATPV
jgi:hypothetical protein